MLLFGMPSLQAQEETPKHELSVSFQGLGLGAMPFSGPVEWDDQPNLSLGFAINYTYWFNNTFGVRTGVRVNSLSHNQRIGNLDIPWTTSLPLSSLGLPGGSALTTVNLRGTATSLQEEQRYTFIEVPILLAMRFDGFFVNLGVSLAKAVNASADYSYTDPACVITALPDLGVTPTSPVPMTLNGAKEGTVKNADMVKPFYCLLDVEAGYNFPIGDASSIALGLFGRFAPVKYTNENPVDVYVLDPTASTATYTVAQPTTTTLVEKIGYYELGISLGLNFGLGRSHSHRTAPAADNTPVLTPSNNQAVNNNDMSAELAAMKAARQKDESELAAMKAAQQKTQDELAAMKAAQQRAENELAALKAERQNARQTESAKPTKSDSPKAVAQQKLDNLGATIYFDFKGTKVKPAPEEEEAILAICEAMKADPQMKVVITGHADNSGSYRVNWRYGQKRAKALKRYMVKLGAPAENITCESKGERQPVADNSTREGRAQNRRATVELR